MSYTKGEKGVDRLGSDNAKVNRKTEDWVGILNGPVVCVIGVGKFAAGGKVCANSGVLAGLVSEVTDILCSPVPITVVRLIAGFRKGQLGLPINTVVSNATSYIGWSWGRAGAGGGRGGGSGFLLRLRGFNFLAASVGGLNDISTIGSGSRRGHRGHGSGSVRGCTGGPSNTVIPLSDSVAVSGNPLCTQRQPQLLIEIGFLGLLTG